MATKKGKTGPASKHEKRATQLFGVALRADWVAFAERFPNGWTAGDDHSVLGEWAQGGEAGAELEPLEDVATLYGPEAGGATFWNEPLWRHGYPVGRAMNGDELVQIAGGETAGAIFRIDHETIDEPLLSWTGSTDGLVDALLEEPGEIVADSMYALCARVCAALRPVPRAPTAFPELPSAMQTLAVDGDRVLLGPSYEGGPVVLIERGELRALPVSRTRVGRVALRGPRMLLLHSEGLELSSDGGATFRTLDVGAATDATIDAQGTLWVSRDGEAGFSTDEGRSFTWRAAGPGRNPGHLVTTRHGIAAIHHHDFFLISKDAIRESRPRRSRSNRAVTETAEGTLLLLVEGAGVIRSVDGGEKWRKAKGKVFGGQHLLTSADGSITAIDGKTRYRSTDDGKSFERAGRLRDEPEDVAPLGDGILVLYGRELEWVGGDEKKKRGRR